MMAQKHWKQAVCFLVAVVLLMTATNGSDRQATLTFPNQTYYFSVLENSNATIVGQVQATNGVQQQKASTDYSSGAGAGGGQAEPVYSLQLAQDSIFSRIFDLDNITGVLSKKLPLDRELFPHGILLTAEATSLDANGALLTTVCNISIAVQDVNDNAPVLTEKRFAIKQSLQAGSKIGQLFVCDEDMEQSVSFNLLNVQLKSSTKVNVTVSSFLDLIGIKAKSGEVYLKKSIAKGLELQTLALDVTASNTAPPYLSSQKKTYEVHILQTLSPASSFGAPQPVRRVVTKSVPRNELIPAPCLQKIYTKQVCAAAGEFQELVTSIDIGCVPNAMATVVTEVRMTIGSNCDSDKNRNITGSGSKTAVCQQLQAPPGHVRIAGIKVTRNPSGDSITLTGLAPFSAFLRMIGLVKFAYFVNWPDSIRRSVNVSVSSVGGHVTTISSGIPANIGNTSDMSRSVRIRHNTTHSSRDIVYDERRWPQKLLLSPSLVIFGGRCGEEITSMSLELTSNISFVNESLSISDVSVLIRNSIVAHWDETSSTLLLSPASGTALGFSKFEAALRAVEYGSSLPHQLVGSNHYRRVLINGKTTDGFAALPAYVNIQLEVVCARLLTGFTPRSVHNNASTPPHIVTSLALTAGSRRLVSSISVRTGHSFSTPFAAGRPSCACYATPRQHASFCTGHSNNVYTLFDDDVVDASSIRGPLKLIRNLSGLYVTFTGRDFFAATKSIIFGGQSVDEFWFAASFKQYPGNEGYVLALTTNSGAHFMSIYIREPIHQITIKWCSERGITFQYQNSPSYRYLVVVGSNNRLRVYLDGQLLGEIVDPHICYLSSCKLSIFQSNRQAYSYLMLFQIFNALHVTSSFLSSMCFVFLGLYVTSSVQILFICGFDYYFPF